MLSGDFMIIQQLDNTKVLIVLDAKEMSTFKLNFTSLSLEDPHCKKILKRLLSVACNKAEMSAKDNNILVEALPKDNGCILLLTFISKQSRKIYKIKKTFKTVTFLFDNVESIIKISVILSKHYNITNNDIFYFDNNYYLIFDKISGEEEFIPLLKEFSQDFYIGKEYCAMIKEYGSLLANNGIKTFSTYFKK